MVHKNQPNLILKFLSNLGNVPKKLLNLINVSIKTRLIIMLVVVSILAMWTSTLICSYTGQQILTAKIFDQLVGIRTSKARQIEDYFQVFKSNVLTLSNGITFKDAVKEFTAAYKELENVKINPNFQNKINNFYQQDFLPNLAKTIHAKPMLEVFVPQTTTAVYLQYHYIANNVNPVGKKNLLDEVSDGTKYSSVHAKFNPMFREIVGEFGYADMYLFDPAGNIVYSYAKEPDFGTNINQGPYKNSNLANAFNEAIASQSQDFVKIADYESYTASSGQASAFATSPIFDGGKMIGVLALQLPTDKINSVMTNDQKWEENGLGKTGETYLVGRDLLMRSDSRFFIEDRENYLQVMKSVGTDQTTLDEIKAFGTTVLWQEIESEAAKLGRLGNKGSKITRDYRNIPALVAYSPLEIPQLRWIIVAKIDIDEAYGPIYHFQRLVLIGATVIMLTVTLLALWLSGIFVTPIKNLMKSSHQVSLGKTDIVSSGSQDEFADLAKSFNQTIRKLKDETYALKQQNSENEKLVFSLIPPLIAQRIKRGELSITDAVDNVAVLFADLHRFTRLFQEKTADEVVGILDELMTAFDNAAEKYGIEKIKTLGDGYLGVCGLLVPHLDSDKLTIDFALEMLVIVRRLNYEKGLNLDLRIGINSGEVIAGVIGKNKPIYDVWGNTVNNASRLESSAPPGVILVSQNIYERLQDAYQFERFPDIQESGKAKLVAWQLKLN